jgi:surface antigen/LysM repeat protein
MGDTIQKLKNWLKENKIRVKRLAFFIQYYAKKSSFLFKLRLPSLKRAHLNAFPAVHLKKMDNLDLALKFSSELLMAFLAVLVGAFTIGFFKFGNPSSADNSYAFTFLSNHTTLDNKYYAQQTSIKTIVESGGLIAEAQADDFEGLSTQAQTAPVGGGNSIITNDSLVQPSPDSVKELVAKQVKIYTTVAGDTLASVAAANGITVKTLADSNNLLTNAVLQPGWQLVILPVNGMWVTAGANDTLPDLAHEYNPEKYNPDATVRENEANTILQNMLTYNGLDSEEDINPGDLIIIPGGEIVGAPPAPAPAPKSNYSGPDNSANEVTSLGDGYDGVNHIFPVGYCTYYVAERMKITFGGNAKNWLANARASGYVTGSQPAVHSAVVFSGYGYGRYGHVAYVEAVNGDGTITVSEMNYDHFDRVDQRIVSINSSAIRGYIYP